MQDIKAFFEEQARNGNGHYAIAYALLTHAEAGGSGNAGRWSMPPRHHDGPDPVFQRLAMLGGLRDGGMLTEEEFAAQKAKILDQL